MKNTLREWMDKHPKEILIGMVLSLFVCLCIMIVGLFRRKTTTEEDLLKRFKETTQKAHKTSQTSYGAITDVNELYQKSKSIMQKDSLSQEDIAYLRMADSTLTALIKLK